MRVRLTQLVSHKDGLYALDDRGCLWLKGTKSWDQVETPELRFHEASKPDLKTNKPEVKTSIGSLYNDLKSNKDKPVSPPAA